MTASPLPCLFPCVAHPVFSYFNIFYQGLNTLSYSLVLNVAEENYSPVFEVFPNPFNTTTTIKYELPKESKVILSVSDMTGRLVEALVNRTQVAGYYSFQWDANHYSSGIYFYCIQVDGFQRVKKCLLIK
ncbi:MAG: hypothetical protein COT43_09960 [Candidatus Marinimicrobia bacterium CG08_land_8_20_14_0_20_45_22]|nr:MAG: hypothetical protein COT43_09960 [Candidatus Marinimicrobia bacterium CG08_land_8_20_14_0_20_45_22]